jgi:dephospho-CoA kinase
MGELIILRGLPGSGKTTFANLIGASGAGCAHFEADMFFETEGKYKFDGSKLKEAHKWCLNKVEWSMLYGNLHQIIVSNTFTQEWEMEPYFKLAEENEWKVTTVIVENRHDGKNIHSVPDEKIQEMKKRFDIKL